MITWNGESTAIRGAEESQDGERADTNGNSETDCEDRIFCTLRPSELLKHLLRGAKCSSPQCKSDQDDSDNERVTLTQEVPKQLSAVNQYDGEINRIHVHNYNENLVYVKAPLPGQNGNMKYIPCEANENVETTLQKASVYLLNEEIQDSVVEFAVSGHNNSTFQDTPLDEDDFSTLECFNTCTDNLVGAQTEFWTKISCQESVDCELTNLQPLIAKTSEVVRKLSSASTRDNLLHSKRTEKDLVRCEVIFGKNISRKRSSGSDSDVDEVTVLVPAGKYYLSAIYVSTHNIKYKIRVEQIFFR